MQERTHWMQRVSRVATTPSTGAGTHGKDSTPLVLEEDHLHSNFTSVRAKTVSGGCCCFLLKSLKNKKSLSSRPKILISIMLSLTQSLTALDESSFFLSLGLVCDELGKLTLMGVVLPMYLLWICRTCLFLRMEKTVRCYLGQHLNLELKYMLKDKNACKYFSGLGPNKHGKGSYSSLYVNKLLVVLSRMIHLPVFLRGNPSNHLLDWCWQCQRWGRGCALNQSQQSLWTKSAWK